MKGALVIPALLLIAFAPISSPAAETATEVVPRDEVRFQPLNPARGDASPKAGVLWGDIRKDVPTGTLIEFVGGFASPPHIHNITYRGVVISGSVHNDDPEAEIMLMGPGSFWIQPAGEPHITTAAPGEKSTAFLEIFSGPYLVKPATEAFDNGERPVNLEARNVVWLDASDVAWIDQPAASSTGSEAKMAFLWGTPRDGEKNGTFLKLPAGFTGELRGSGAWLRAVVIKGRVGHKAPGNSGAAELEPGSYFGATGTKAHEVSCKGGSECTIYMSTEGKYTISSR